MITYKLLQVVGVLVLLFGIIELAGLRNGSGAGPAVVGMVVYAVGRVGTWLTAERK